MTEFVRLPSELHSGWTDQPTGIFLQQSLNLGQIRHADGGLLLIMRPAARQEFGDVNDVGVGGRHPPHRS